MEFQNNHPGKILHCCNADLLFIFLLTFNGTNCAVLLFSSSQLIFYTFLPMNPFPFLFIYLLLSSRPTPLIFQSAKWGFTARCWSLWPAVNVHLTVWPGRQELLLAAVKMDTTRLTPTLLIWLAHVRIFFNTLVAAKVCLLDVMF